MKRALVLAALVACSNGGGQAATRSAAGPEVATPGAAASAPAGHVVTATFHSDALGVDKDVTIYLPAGYEAAPAKHWPVLYYLHGLTGDETNWVKLAHLDATADRLALAAIVVMPDGDNNFYADSAMAIDYEACLRDGTGLLVPSQPKKKTCVRHATYETYIVKDLIGWVDHTYRTIPSREGRAIAGLSMGGFGAFSLAMRHPDLFAAAASHSGVVALMYNGPFPYENGKVVLETEPAHWGTAVGPIGAWVRGIFGADLATWRAYDPAAQIATLAPGTLALYLDCGTEDDFLLHNGAQYVHQLLLDRHLEHEFFLGPGHHDFGFWTARLPNSLTFLSAHVTAAR